MSDNETESRKELILKSIEDLDALAVSCNEILEQIKEDSSKPVSFAPILSRCFSLKLRMELVAYLPISEILGDFETLVRQEDRRVKEKTRPLDQLGECLLFFLLVCARIKFVLNSFMTLFAEDKPIPQLPEGALRKRRIVILVTDLVFQFVLTRACLEHPSLEVVGIATNVADAEKLFEDFHPDVGIIESQFHEDLMNKYAIPMIIIGSKLSEEKVDLFNILYAGAIDFHFKEDINEELSSNPAYKRTLGDRIYSSSFCSLSALMRYYLSPNIQTSEEKLDTNKVLAVGISRGSIRPLWDILKSLPEETPPILIAHTFEAGFAKKLKKKLSDVVPITVDIAKDGETLEPGKIYVIPDDKQAVISKEDEESVIQLNPLTPDQQMNSMLESVAEAYGESSVGLLLGGNSEDGVKGLSQIKAVGGHALVQMEYECLCPKLSTEARKADVCTDALWLDQIVLGVTRALKPGIVPGEQTNANSQRLSLDLDLLRVLIVDDSKTIRVAMTQHLKALGINQYSEAVDGLEAWNHLFQAVVDSNQFSLILCDESMPGMTGLELLRDIRANDRLCKTPFILVTSLSDRKTVLAAIEFGVSAFVVKPITVETLREKINEVFSRELFKLKD